MSVLQAGIFYFALLAIGFIVEAAILEIIFFVKAKKSSKKH